MYKSVSIIIPSLNVSSYIGHCLEALTKLDYPKDRFEIIIVDNGSTDNTLEIVRRYGAKVFIKRSATISTLRNLGAKNAGGEILAFIDGDCVVSPNWLNIAVETIERENLVGVGSWYRLPPNAGLIEKIWDVHLKPKITYGPVTWLPSSNFIIFRKVFEVVSGFDESLITGEDYDICNRLAQKRMRLFSAPELSVIHLRNPKSLKEFFVKEFWRGKGAVQMLVAHLPKVRFTKTIVFALAVFVLSLSSVVSIVSWTVAGKKLIFLNSLMMLSLLLIGLTIRTFMRARNFSIAAALILPLLFYLFGLSRALAFLDFRIWKDTIKNIKNAR